MNQQKVLGTAFRLIVLIIAVVLASQGGWHILWLVIVPGLVIGIFREFRPAAPRPPSAKFTEPGRYRVVLQVPGNKAIQVIKQIRVTTGLGLLEAKQLVDDAPAVVVEGLSEQSAELVADRLRAAGARALAAPIGEM